MKKALILIAVLMISAGAVFGQTLTAYVLESEPLGFVEDGKAQGEHYDYLKAIADKAGVDLEIKIVPKTKLFAAIKSGEADMAIFFRSAKWDETVEYAGKIRDIRIVAVNRVGKPLNKFSDLHNSSRVGIIANTSISSDFDNDSNIKRHSVPNYETLLKTMAGGRVDTGVGNAIVISYLINKLGYDSKIQADGITLGVKEQWLQFSKKSAHLDQLEKFAAALEELKASGELDSILDSYAGVGWRELNSTGAAVPSSGGVNSNGPDRGGNGGPAGPPRG